MVLTDADLSDFSAWRRLLHRAPDLAGAEAETACEVRRFLAPTAPDQVIAGLGGHGVAFVYRGRSPGPTVLFRAELDALPIEEISTFAHRSARAGSAHLCGHDGHMAILAATAQGFAAERPQRGRAVLLFQPAEEDGSGAAAVIADPKFKEIAPDMAFAWHNMPGRELGRAALKAGPVNCASLGMRIALLGKTSHASTPQLGVSPMAAVASPHAGADL